MLFFADEAQLEPVERLYVERKEVGGMLSVLRSDDYVKYEPVISSVNEFIMANETMLAVTEGFHDIGNGLSVLFVSIFRNFLTFLKGFSAL